MSNEIIPINAKGEIAKELRRIYEQWHNAGQAWASSTLAFAEKLWEARQQHDSNHAFGIWLAENEIDGLGKDDRAALINMGQHLELTRIALEETDSRSPRLIWRDLIEPKLSSQPCEHELIPEILPQPVPKAPIPEETQKQPVQKKELASSKSRPGRKTILSKFPRSEEVVAIYAKADTRVALGKLLANRGTDKIWNTILRLIDAGLLKEKIGRAHV